MDFRRLRNREIDRNEAAARLAEMLRAARDAVIFTGAGISTESGIPDFRSPGGIWTQMAPIDFQDFVSSAAMRKEAWRRRFAMEDMFARVRPNAGHEAVAVLVRRGIAGHVITQNIDNLHQASGIAAHKVFELHGNTTYAACLDCAARYEIAWVRERFEAAGQAPDCIACGGYIKTATIAFGQAMPEEAMRRAESYTASCDLFLAIGSSLEVWPAAGFPMLAKRNGARLVILNRDPTEFDDLADLVIRDDIGATLEAFIAQDSVAALPV